MALQGAAAAPCVVSQAARADAAPRQPRAAPSLAAPPLGSLRRAAAGGGVPEGRSAARASALAAAAGAAALRRQRRRQRGRAGPPPRHVGRRFFGGSDVVADESDPGYLAPGPTRSMASVVLTGSFMQRSLVPINNPRNQRALVIGLAGARLPLWLQHTFGDDRMVVDVVELDKEAIKRAGGTLPSGAVRPLFGAAAAAGAVQDVLQGFESLFQGGAGAQADAATAAEDIVTGADGQKIRVYNVDGEDFVASLAPLIPEELRYNMVFLDACIAGGLEDVLQDPQGRFLKNLKQLLAPRATIGLNVEVSPSEYGNRGEPPRIAAMVRNMVNVCLLGGGDVFTVRPTEADTYKNRIYCFLIEGRPQYLRGGPSIEWAMWQSAQKIQTDFPADKSGKKLRWSFDSEVTSCYQDWPPQKDGTIDQPWVLWTFAAPFVAIAAYLTTGGTLRADGLSEITESLGA